MLFCIIVLSSEIDSLIPLSELGLGAWQETYVPRSWSSKLRAVCRPLSCARRLFIVSSFHMYRNLPRRDNSRGPSMT